MDSRSTITLAGPSALPKPAILCGTVKVTCMHRDAQEMDATKVQVGDYHGGCKLLLGVISDLPIPLLLGKYLPSLAVDLSAPKGEYRQPRLDHRSQWGYPMTRRALLAEEPEVCTSTATKGEFPSATTPPLSCVSAGCLRRRFWSGAEGG